MGTKERRYPPSGNAVGGVEVAAGVAAGRLRRQWRHTHTRIRITLPIPSEGGHTLSPLMLVDLALTKQVETAPVRDPSNGRQSGCDCDLHGSFLSIFQARNGLHP